MVSIRLLISNSFRSRTNPLITVPRAPITIGINVTFMFLSFSISWQGLGTYSSFRILSTLLCVPPGQQILQSCKFFQLYSVVPPGQQSSQPASSFNSTLLFRQDSKVHNYYKVWRLAEIRWSVCISKFPRTLCVAFSRTGSRLCICSYGQNSMSCIILSGSPCTPSV